MLKMFRALPLPFQICFSLSERLLKESIEREKVRMEEMDEEEYDALSDEERARIDRRRLDEIRERKRREQLKLEREMEERRQQEEMERLREEEEMKKKNKKGKLKELSKEDQLLGKKSQQGVKQATNNSSGRSDTKMEQIIGERKMSYQEKPESLPTEHSDIEHGNKKKKIKERKDGKAAPPEVNPSSPEEAEKEPMSEGEKLLVQRFKLYNHSQKAISQTLDYWDRVQGVLIHPVAPDDTPQEGEEPIPERPVPERPGPERTVPSGKKGRKEREKERAEKERLEKEKIDRLKVEGEFKACLSPAPSPQTTDGDEVEAEEQLEARGEVGVPHILLNVIGQNDPSAQKVLESKKLPPLDEKTPNVPVSFEPSVFVSHPLREQLKLEREMEERRQQEEMERLREEEEMKKKNKKGKLKELSKEDQLLGKRSQQGVKQATNNSRGRSDTKMEQIIGERKMSYQEKPESLPTEHSDIEHGNKKKKIKERKDGKAAPPEVNPSSPEEAEKEPMSEGEKLLVQRFKLYNQSQKAISQTLDYWDRVQGVLIHPVAPDETSQEGEEPIPERPVPERPGPERTVPSGKKGRKEREKERAEKERLEKEKIDRLKVEGEFKACLSPAPSPQTTDGDEVEAEEQLEARGEVGVPHILLNVIGQGDSSAQKVLESRKLPPLDEVLDGLGQGPKGPPIPPSTIFSVVPYPGKRTPPNGQDNLSHFEFLVPSSEDVAEDKKEAELEMDSMGSISILKEDAVTPTRGRLKKEKVDPQKRRTTTRKGQRGVDTHSPSLGALTPVSDADQGGITGETLQDKSQGQKELSKEDQLLGKKSQQGVKQATNNSSGRSDTKMEQIIGERKMSYQEKPESLPTEHSDIEHGNKKKKIKERKDGKAAPPEVNPSSPEEAEKEPMSEGEKLLVQRFKLYNHSQKAISQTLDYWDRVQGVLIHPVAPDDTPQEGEEPIPERPVPERPGPERTVPSGKKGRKEREKERAEKERLEKEKIDRLKVEGEFKACLSPAPSPQTTDGDEVEAEEQLEARGEVGVPHILLNVIGQNDPSAQKVNYSTVIRCVMINAEEAEKEPMSEGEKLLVQRFKLYNHSQKAISQTLCIHRKDTKTIHLRNSNRLPVAWKLSGLTTFRWLVPPNGEVTPRIHFNSTLVGTFDQTLNFELTGTKRRVCLPINQQGPQQVSDVENILGIVHTENIQIHAEAYDVALDLSFPKGTDGGLDFGAIKVAEEAKLTLSLKNKGKYEIAYSFTLEATEPDMPDLHSLFTIQPHKGTLNPSEHPMQVQIVFRSRKEVVIKDQAILCCKVIEPNVSEGGETIACIPVKVSIRSLFRKYSFIPGNDLNFGAIVFGIHKIRTFTIENKGEFEIRYTIFKMMTELPVLTQKKCGPAKRNRSCEDAPGKLLNKARRSDSIQKDMGITPQARFTVGAFTVSPGFGTLSPGGHQVISVDCAADQAGKCEEIVAIDISDRDPEDQPRGIAYRLVAEVCIQSIVTNDIASIFEEHRICKNINLYQSLQTVDSFVEDENKFLFNNVLVGLQVKARFKIINTGKVHCIVTNDIASIFEEHRICKNINLYQSLQTMDSFVEDENKFLFNNVLVGLQVKARFKIINTGKVHCDLSVTVKPVSSKVGHLHSGCTKNITMTFRTETPVTLRAQLVKCKISKIAFQQPVDQVIETDPEPAYTVLENTARELPLQVSAVADYAQIECKAETIRFKDTLLFQTRVFEFQMLNKGNVQLEFSWQVLMESYGKGVSFSEKHANLPEGQGNGTQPLSRSGTRPVSALESVSPLLTGDPDLPPFIVEPSTGVIAARKKQVFMIKFSPLDVAEFEGRLVCSIPNLKDDQGPTMSVKGRSLLPFCHFDLVDSDYISSNQRDPELRGPRGAPPRATLDSNTRVIEFFSVGLSTTITRTFDIMKPTNAAYSFQWKCDDPADLRLQPVFRCLTEKDTIRAGKKVENTFEFLPQQLDIAESFWTFLIPEHNNAVPFLLVGRSYLNYRSLLIVNSEETAFNFSFRETFRHSEGFLDSLTLQPMEGVVPPKSRVPVVISFNPTHEGKVNINLMCDVKGKTFPLTMNMKVDSYSMNASLQYEKTEGELTQFSLDKANEINFQQMELNEKAHCNFFVSNTGKFILGFQWELWGPKELLRFLKVVPETSSVVVGQQTRSTLSFYPRQRCVLKDVGLKLKIRNGPTFNCTLAGSAVPPGVHFSFTKHNFGMNFLAGLVPCSQNLVITNKGEKEARVPVVISFNPTHEGKVNINLMCDVKGKTFPLTMNMKVDSYSMNASLQYEKTEGELTQFSLDKANEINFQQMELNEKAHCNFFVSNTGKFILGFQWELWGPKELLRFLKVVPETSSVVVGQQTRSTLSFYPRQRCVLKDVGLKLKIKNGPTFNCTLAGSAVPPGVHFSFTKHNFGMNFIAGLVPCLQKLVITNKGEKEASPLNLSQDIRYDNLSCFIEGGKPLKLTLTGSCVMAPITKEVVNFVCQVRTRQSQSILLQNKTNQLWNLRPVIEGEQWSGPPSFVVEPHQPNKPYEITYRPLTMTLDGKKHQGSVFFAFPDGTGLLSLLQGFAEQPKSSGNITREVPSKTSYSELLPISNWLPKPQRFRVIVELIKPDKLDCTTLLKGLDYIEVPALTKRDYKLNFFSYKEGQFSAKVTFRNETTQEYLYYTVNFKATPPGIISTIEMTSPVRQCTSAVIKVDNPLLTPVTFTTDCKLQDINFPTHLTVPVQSEHHDLGIFQYELVLKALPAGLEKPLYFRTTLGSSHAINAKFINFCRVKTEYTCKIDSPDFHLEKTISAAPGSQRGTEVSVEVIFEPSQLGETRGVLSISSPVGGDYTIPLYGSCGPPKAQGPFSIRTGSTASIPFKNIFLQTTAFSFQVDNPAFTVKLVFTF
ncbi:UNVERIFIED_CONTAM: hypothetical protein FKN15_053854 [Acipenser sinensis]